MTNLKDIINLSEITGDVVAVGVSGGADSLALLLLMDELLWPLGRRVAALTVDHGLRKESRAEAEYVAGVAAARGIEHHILTWKGDKPRSGVEEAARTARYALLCSWCHEHGVETLCMAHHQQDQAETFLIRLQRGSGLTGLCGMAAVSRLNGLKIVRPLLEVPAERLKQYLHMQKVQWVDDPSNQSDDFLRCRVRKLLPLMEEMAGITTGRIAGTMRVLSRSRDYICRQTEIFIQNNVLYWEGAGVSLGLRGLREEHEEIVYQVLRQLIKEIGQRPYTPRAEDVERLMRRLLSPAVGEAFRGATLGNCEIFTSKGKVWIIPELKLKRRMPRNVWADFIRIFPEYARQELPYKLRVALVKNKMPIEF